MPDGILIAFDRMRTIKEIDRENQVAVVEPGVTLEDLDGALAPLGLVYPVSPGEPARRSAATSPPTPAACAPCATA